MAKPTSMLLDLLYRHNPARRILDVRPVARGLADVPRFPLLAIVGQNEMKLALILALINPHIGGVLLIGPRGTGKTTAVRGLSDLLPAVERSTCPYGCEPEAALSQGLEALCPACAQKLARGEPLTAPDRMRLVELPLNARLDDVVGGLNERVALEQQRVQAERGLLAQADQNVLYIDEVNLLDQAIADAILDAAAQGQYTVRRGALAATFRARIVLVGSMNPEEGALRPQIHDRFGLRVVVRSLTAEAERLEVYRRARAYRANPYAVAADWANGTRATAQEIVEARTRLPKVKLTHQVEKLGLSWIKRLRIDSHRTEITLFEAARAHAAADDRIKVTARDLRAVAPLALRQRRSQFMTDYVHQQSTEDRQIRAIVGGLRTKRTA
jgi:magnesium chelatase subunit I